MHSQGIRESVARACRRHRKAIGRIVHHVPAPPLIHLVFDAVFPRMLHGREHAKFKGVKTDFQFTFSRMPGERSWVIDVDDGKVRVRPGEADFPHLVINASARDFIDLATGYLPEAQAMMSGRLAINGGPATKMKMIMALFG